MKASQKAAKGSYFSIGSITKPDFYSETTNQNDYNSNMDRGMKNFGKNESCKE